MATIRERVLIKHPKFDVRAEVRASHDDDRTKHNGDFVDVATVCIETGAAVVQVYATAQQLRELAAVFTTMAERIEAVPAEVAEAA
jgi:hypothetical protein